MEWCKIFYKRYVSKPLISVLKDIGATPNQVTIFNHILTLTVVVWAFSRGTWLGGLIGCFVMFINVLFDYADGDLAVKTGQQSPAGEWFDSVFDVVIQNAVMAAVAIGCFKMGMPLITVIWFFVGNAACNLVSFHYNATFEFNSHSGNKLFRQYMEKSQHGFIRWNINRFFKNLIDPTSSAVGLVLYTARYWVLIGAIFNIMPLTFLIVTVLLNIRWFIMYVLYALHLKEYKKLWVLQALACLDKDREEYYALRNRKEVRK